MENKYIISESKLIGLLTAYHYANYLNYLNAGGMDNWIWYMTNKKECLEGFQSFEDIAKSDLKYYTKIKE